MNAMVPVAEKVMSCIAIGLGLDKDFFKEVCWPASLPGGMPACMLRHRTWPNGSNKLSGIGMSIPVAN
jgi:hypothetical protein